MVMKSTASGRVGMARRGAALDLLHLAPPKRWSLERGHRLVVVGGDGDVPAWVVWGAWRLSPFRGYRLRDHRQRSPYAGWMRWHHYLGLIFGFTTMMFVFSGMLSMDPWDWHPGTAPTRDQRERSPGGPLVTADLPAAACVGP